MSTHSIIAKELSNGTYRAISCHWDGYVENNGKILLEHYKTPEKIDALLDLGDISSLAPNVEAPKGHSYDNKIPGYVVAYHRDRGEEKVDAELFTKEQLFALHGYVYFFKDGRWNITNKELDEKGVFN